jgi:hypothetical protein
MNNVTMRVAMTFVAPDPKSVAMSAMPEINQAGLDGEHLDAMVGLRVTPVAQISFLNEDTGEVLESMFMSQDEMARALTEMRAIHDAMAGCAEIVDRGWQRYRDAIRRRAVEEDRI